MSGHTYTHTHIHTYTHDNYYNPRCACAPRVNNNTVVVTIVVTIRFTLLALQWPVGAVRAMAAAVVKVAVVFVGARHASIATSEKHGV